MSASYQSAGSSADRFTEILKIALTEYQRVTRKRLPTHPLAAQLDACNSPKAVLDILRTQAKAFSKFGKSEEELMRFSSILGEGIGLVSYLTHPV
jgi:hypothetical protein